MLGRRVLPNENSETSTDIRRAGSAIGASRVKPLPAPNVPGNTDAERMDNALRKILTVSKTDLLKAEANWKRARARKKRAKKI
jgi:hypothetical protein